ncbi:MAG: DNA-protecting protein DprA [Deltaproteobacteria bacterium]|nr:DNA-protecting protein DprA [Deltaproteobacteria bacterium]
MEKESLEYWLALNRIQGFGPAERRAFLDSSNDAVDMFEGPPLGVECLRAAVAAARGLSMEDWDWVKREIELIGRHNARVITVRDSLYPGHLRRIYDPPLLLYAKGKFYDTDRPCVAVVGTRRASPYGLSMAGAIARDLAAAGMVVVSGLARGCDSAAHRGALSTGGHTVAVLGTGIDVTYPGENRRLQDEIAEKGLLLSEFPVSTPPFPGNFPVRNRIISGMALGVAVVEAPLRSGAMMTARLALEQGREVFAFPGPAGMKKAAGTNKLIKDGATLVEGAEDVLKAFFPDFRPPESAEKGAPSRTAGWPSRPAGSKVQNPVRSGAEDGLAEKVAELLSEGPMHIDSIAEKSGLPVQKVSSVLLSMELNGMVEQKPGKLFMLRL